MKTLIKILILVLVVVLIMSMLTACARKGYCETCGQYEKLNRFVDRDGNVFWLCNTCYSLAKLFY